MYPYNSCRKAAGSAMTEFILLLFVLLPVGFGTAMLGKLTDLKQQAEQASRYSAWEATVYSRQALLAQQNSSLDRRFFLATDTPVSSHPPDRSKDARGNDSEEHSLWGRSSAEARGLRELAKVSRLQDSEVLASYNFDTGKAKAALVTGSVAASAGRPLSGLNGNSWDIVADGLLRTTVDIPLQNTRFLPGNAHCTSSSARPVRSGSASHQSQPACIRASGVILADGWGASGDAQAVSRVRSLVPGSGLDRVGKAVGGLLGSFIFPELDPLDKAFGHVDMKVLPRYAKP